MGDMTEPEPADSAPFVTTTPTGEWHYIAVGPIKEGQAVGVTFDGRVVSIHACGTPEPLGHDSDTWTCPECGKPYERHWDAWWQEPEA